MTYRPSPCMRYACSTQATYSAGVSSPIMSVRLRIKVFRFRQLSTRVAMMSLPCRRSDLPGHSTPQELAHAFFAEPLGAVDDQLAAQEDLFDPARDRAPFEHRVIHPTVTLGTPDGPGLVGIEQNDIRIGADGDGALAGKQAEQPGRRGGSQLDEAVQRQPVLPDPAVEDQRQPGLHAGRTVGNLAEVVPALRFGKLQAVRLLVEAEGAMVGRDHLEIIGPEAAPQRLLVG